MMKYIAFAGAFALSWYTFGLKQGVLLFVILLLFGWGMNLENKQKKTQAFKKQIESLSGIKL